MFSNSSIPARLANLSAEAAYHKYIRLLNRMGESETVNYNIEDLAYAQNKMMKARRLDQLKKETSTLSQEQEVSWSGLIGGSREWQDFEIHEQPLSYISMMHPIFSFSHHARGYDSGHNQIIDLPVRGDSLSVPVVSEGGQEIYFISIGFHKGDMHVFFSFFPERPDAVREELAGLLQGYETR